ncbi:MAG: O-methyltransferase [Bacteroidetes bacterium]|nr:O-methyltransferase [Bacteroidota bacterium]
MTITDLLSEYAEAHTTPEPPVLEILNRETHLSQVYPQMLSGHLQGALLRMFVQMIRPKRGLEIGTFTGYSAIAMGLGMTVSPASPHGIVSRPTPIPGERGDALLHTIEVNPELEEGIRHFIRAAGLDERIILHIGEALEIIPTLDEIWDLVFIDADKPNYLNYYNTILPKVRPGGFVIADNVLWRGKVTGDPVKMDKDTCGIIEFNEFVTHDDRVENLILPVRDGLMVIRKLDIGVA